jgi:hypothetical protein
LGQIGAQISGQGDRFDGGLWSSGRVEAMMVWPGLDLDGAVVAGGADEFLSSSAGAIMIGVRKAGIGLSHTYSKTVEVIVEADTRAL